MAFRRQQNLTLCQTEPSKRRPPRRFSGDDTLLPGRYYSVAKDAGGRDGFTIRRELLAYLEAERTGWVWVADLTEQSELDVLRLDGGPRDALALLLMWSELGGGPRRFNVADVQHVLSAEQILGGNQWKTVDLLPALPGICYQRPRKNSHSYFHKSFQN